MKDIPKSIAELISQDKDFQDKWSSTGSNILSLILFSIDIYENLKKKKSTLEEIISIEIVRILFVVTNSRLVYVSQRFSIDIDNLKASTKKEEFINLSKVSIPFE